MPVCLPGQTGLLQCVHGPIMCRQTKAEATSKSLMQNLCSCGCFSGLKNQYCEPDARRWLSALWLTVKAERDWAATFTVLEMEWHRVALIVWFSSNLNFIVDYFCSNLNIEELKNYTIRYKRGSESALSKPVFKWSKIHLACGFWAATVFCIIGLLRLPFLPFLYRYMKWL